MSHPHTISNLDDLIDRALNQLPRLALLAAITLAWVATLAWPPPPADFQPRLASGQQVTPQYPLRVLLPEATPLPTAQLADLIEEHESGASRQLATASGSTTNPGNGLPRQDPGSNRETVLSELAPGEVLAINYDLSSLEPTPEKVDRSTGSLTVQKQLYVNGVSSGAATIRIDEGAQILIATKSVALALGDKTEALPRRISGALAKGTGFIPFYELRSAGINVTYDPVNDRVSLSTVS